MQTPGRDDDEVLGSMVRVAGSPGGPGDSVGPGDENSIGAENAAAGDDPQVDRASLDSEPAEEASDSDEDLGRNAAAGDDPQVDSASLDSGPAEEASDSDEDLGSEGSEGNEVLEFTLTVPFMSDVDAAVARRFLMSGAQLYRGMVLWELRVIGTDLFIRLTAEDSELLQISTVSLLIRLFIVRHIMQHLVPPVFANFQDKRAD